jgi:hypothetical protein
MDVIIPIAYVNTFVPCVEEQYLDMVMATACGVN